MRSAPAFCRTALVALVASSSAAPASAAEAFLCGPDNVVYVEAADLPEKKKTDPCIAAYFGLKVEAKTPTPAKPKIAAKSVRARPAEVLPLKAAAVETGSARTETIRQARLLAATPAVTAPGTDYRNVRIINARPGEPDIFVHEK